MTKTDKTEMTIKLEKVLVCPNRYRKRHSRSHDQHSERFLGGLFIALLIGKLRDDKKLDWGGGWHAAKGHSSNSTPCHCSEGRASAQGMPALPTELTGTPDLALCILHGTDEGRTFAWRHEEKQLGAFMWQCESWQRGPVPKIRGISLGQN